MNWQPIETAPKDGTSILLFQPDDANIWCPCREKQMTTYTFVGWFDRNHCAGPNWVCSEYDAFEKSPTHWMPLPEPPNG